MAPVTLTAAQKRDLSRIDQLAEIERLKAEAKQIRMAVRAERVAKVAAARAEAADLRARRTAARLEREAAKRPPVSPKNGVPLLPRRKGSVGQFNFDIKTMIINALEKVGGVNYLAKQAHENPVAFMGLIGKVLPLQLTGAGGGPLEGRVEHVITFVGANASSSVALPHTAPKRFIDSTVIDMSERIADGD